MDAEERDQVILDALLPAFQYFASRDLAHGTEFSEMTIRHFKALAAVGGYIVGPVNTLLKQVAAQIEEDES
jgi:hypothetical protein